MARSRRSPTRPPRRRAKPARPRGPNLYAKLKRPTRLSGPGRAPAGFAAPTNSQTEWVAYWAMARATGFPRDPRQGPFVGWPGLWKYQSPYEGGRVTGGQVIDIVYERPGSLVGGVAIRVTTERYHILTDFVKRAMDKILQARLGKHFIIVDVYEQELLADANGESAVLAMKKAIFGGRFSDPVSSATARRAR